MLTKQQRIDRHAGLGGSDAAAVLGLSPWTSPLDLYLDKRGELDEEPEQPTNWQRWGHLLEDLIADEASAQLGIKTARRNQTIVHKAHPWMRANIDRRVLNERAIMECKSTGWKDGSAWGEPGSDEVPVYYATQAHHYLEVTGLERCYMPVLFLLNRSIEVYVIERDKSIAERLIAAEAKFWTDHVLAGVPPEPRTIAEVRKIWRGSGELEVIASDEVDDWHAELEEARATIKATEKRRDELVFEIAKFMQDAAILMPAGGDKPLATHKPSVSTVLDQKRLKDEYPDVYDACTTERKTRRFLSKKRS